MPRRKKQNKMDSDSSRQHMSGTDAPPAPVNYHGLMNQGATCYLNSVLQVLFMTRDFREAVQRSMSGDPDPERIDLQLKDLFDDLKERQALTYKITKKLGIDRVYEQQDAAQYYEKILALTSDEASQIFHGELTNKTKCSTCNTEKSSDGKFWHLPLELVKSNSETYHVVDGIKEYFKELSFSGENQMYCDGCDDKSDATTKCELKDPPEVLTLLLKRFEFDYRYMMYVKNNCTVDVPWFLHIPESPMYELYAVVHHCGDLRSGHYMTTVKSQDDGRWYEFDDIRVTLYDHELFQADKPNRSCSAYLLFYRKEKTPAAVSGGLLPAVGKKRKREDNEEPVKVGKERREDRGDVDDQEQQIDERKIMNDDGNVGYTAAEKRGAFAETQPEESREDQDREDNGRLNKPHEGLEAKHNASCNEERGKQEVGIMWAEQGYPEQVNVNMQECEERKIMCEDIDKAGESEGDEQTDKERKTLTKHPNRGEKDEFNGRLDIVKHIKDDEGGKQEVREEYGSPYVSANKKRGEEEIEINNRDDKGGKTGASGGGELSTRPDHYCQKFDNHGEHSASKDGQGCTQRSSSSRSYKRHEAQKEEGKDDEGQMERKGGNDQPPQERSKSESQRRQSGQTNGADARSDRSEQNVSVTQNKSLRLEEQVKEEKSTGDAHHASRRLAENQRVVSVHDRQQVNVNMQRDEERKVVHVNIDKTGESEGDEQTDKVRETLTKHPNRGEKDEFNGRLDVVKHIKDDEGGKQEVREEYGSPYVSANKKRGEEEIEINNRDDKGGKTGASGGGELSTRPDHYCQTFDNHGEHSASKDGQGCKQRSSSSRSYKRHEAQKEEGKDDEGQMERKGGSDQPPQERSKSESQRRQSGQTNGADARSDRSEQNVNVTQNKSLRLEKQVKEEKRTGNTHHGQIRPDMSSRHERSGGSGRPTENQRVVGEQRTRVEDFQSKARDEDGAVGGAEERRSEIKTVEKMSEDGTKRQVNTGRRNERADGAVALPKDFDNISLSPAEQEPRSRKTEHVEGKKKKNKIGCFSFWKKGKNKKKGSGDISQTKKKKNSFFSLFRRKKKNVVMASE